MTELIVIDGIGVGRCVYSEVIALSALGTLHIRRASAVEPDAQGRWWADLSPVGGPRLGPFSRRSEALSAERRWLAAHWTSISGARSDESAAPTGQEGP